MSLSNEVVLRPRFKIELESDRDAAISAFESVRKKNTGFAITMVDDHVFIKIPKEKQHFWSPQLDLEIIQDEEDNTTLYGLFGPKPAVWTMFMFLHFVVGSLFLGFGIWAYTRATLNEPYLLQIVLMAIMIIAWFVLYFAGRMGKTAGRDEMLDQYNFMKETLKL